MAWLFGICTRWLMNWCNLVSLMCGCVGWLTWPVFNGSLWLGRRKVGSMSNEGYWEWRIVCVCVYFMIICVVWLGACLRRRDVLSDLMNTFFLWANKKNATKKCPIVVEPEQTGTVKWQSTPSGKVQTRVSQSLGSVALGMQYLTPNPDTGTGCLCNGSLYHRLHMILHWVVEIMELQRLEICTKGR